MKVLKKLKSYVVTKIGENKGKPRIWLEGPQLLESHFEPGDRYQLDINGESIVLSIRKDGTRIVSKKKIGDRFLPVIDINSNQIHEAFRGHSAVRIIMRDGEIHILPLASEKRRLSRIARFMERMKRGEKLTVGSFAHGGGVLSHAAHAGLHEAGLPARLAFANEIREDLLEHASQVNDAWDKDTQFLCAPLQELVFDPWTMQRVGEVDILEGGIPCSGASRSGRSKNKISMPEAHEHVGHLVAAAVALVAVANPICFVLENVPEYADSASAYIMRYQLRDLGYDVHERILTGKEFNALENRKRWCMVAMTRGIPFGFDDVEFPEQVALKLGDILENFAPDDPRWSRMEGLKAKQERDKEAGKGFMMQLFDESSEYVATITKGYAKIRSTDPKIKHPTDPDLLRQLTSLEHARAKQVPAHLIEGLCQTTAHELLGQGIVYEPFKKTFAAIGRCLRSFAHLGEVFRPASQQNALFVYEKAAA